MAGLYQAGLLHFLPPDMFQQPSPETGVEQKPLVSEEEYCKCFAHPYAYGTDHSKWPGNTILLYKYSSNATTKYKNIPENIWKRIDNEQQRHAEFIMINELEKIQENLMTDEGSYTGILSVEVILSYSPCDGCSARLCSLKKNMDEELKQTRNKDTDNVVMKLSGLSTTTEVEDEEKVKFKITEGDDEEKVKFKITFSNFYKHLDGYRTADQNKEGLRDLLRSGIKLDTFSDDNWHYFFNAAGWFNAERQRRESDDKKILQYLKGSVDIERKMEAQKKLIQDLQNNDLF
ncbi:uncharacterized protein [Mytilus edulis]|uniref:uncharacterized protein n=1 Tax=Mytilus edulis TaxID=6550 RepID=UPI0039F055A1